ncbi:uncharacterized protein LOC109430296 isoform X1 [Aedes albopictus]|uniref:Secreted protein n=1 Tax=Aedes albopictus TaxID=7160 RepID=A0ABM1ZWL1_AEDAL|nr:uncharacterized protein LOC109412411 isoform X1 [Aedes albopictus]
MKAFAVCFAIVLSLAFAAAQRFGSGLPAFSLSSLTGDFGGPTAFGGQDFSSGSLTAAATAGRDPRQNRGPVVFPPPPTDGPMESSGVVVGASGYGFVPPNAPQKYRKKYPYHRHRKPLPHRVVPPKKPRPLYHAGGKKPLGHSPPYKISRPVALESPRPKRTHVQYVAAFTVPGS